MAQSATSPISISTIAIGNGPGVIESFQRISEDTGGISVTINSADEVVDAIIGIIETVVITPDAIRRGASGSSGADPTLSNCADQAGNVSNIVRAGSAGGDVLFCRVLAENREFARNAGEIGNQEVLNQVVIHAVDITSFNPDGSGMVQFTAPAEVCLRGIGRFIFLSALDMPRVPQFPSYSLRGGYTCAVIGTAGTAVLVEQVGGAPPPPPANNPISDSANVGAPPAPIATAVPPTNATLAACHVTTTAMIRIRSAADASSDSTVIETVPYNMRLRATEKVPGWYRVIYQDYQGWISADYLSLSGSC